MARLRHRSSEQFGARGIVSPHPPNPIKSTTHDGARHTYKRASTPNTLYSGFLTALVLVFAVASYAFLDRTELGRIDAMLHEQSEIVAQALRSTTAGGQAQRGFSSADTAMLVASLHDLRARGIRVGLFDASTRATFSTSMVHEGEGPREEQHVHGDSLPENTLQRAASDAVARRVTRSIPTPSGGVRLYAALLPTGLGPGAIVLAYQLRSLDDLLIRARNAAIVAVALAALVSLVGGYFLARHSLAPVSDMRSRADQIGANNLHQRLPAGNPNDELGQLAGTFNALLDRVDRAFEQQRQFMADASHELRTPVAILRGEAEVALGVDDRTREEYRDALSVVGTAADRLTRIVNDVFLLARVDAGQVPPSVGSLYLDEVVADTCRTMRSLAAQRGITLVVDAAQEIPYVGDEALLGRLVMNLVDNAIKYSADNSKVTIHLMETAFGISLTVSNEGSEIPEAAQYVFDRFYRVDGRANPCEYERRW